MAIKNVERIIDSLNNFFNKISYFLLLILNIFCLAKESNIVSQTTKETILFIVKPIYYIVEIPTNFIYDIGKEIKNLIFTYSNNKKLSQENTELRRIYYNSLDVKNENENLKKMLKFVDFIDDSYDYVSTKVYLNIKNSNNHSLLVNVGKNNGVNEGNLVVGLDGNVIGIVVNVLERYSNILLIDDYNFRIAVKILRNNEKLILAGNGDNSSVILYNKSEYLDIQNEDLVFTDGIVGSIPNGFFVGKVIKKNNDFTINVDSNKNNISEVIIIIKK
jgi:rod shape-determining protein MreC